MGNDEIIIERETPPGVEKQVNEIIIERGAGQGLPGIDGTLPALNELDEKPIVVAADLALTGDSADSFNNKKASWQQIIDSVLSIFILKTDLDNVTNDAQLKRSAGDFQAFTVINPSDDDSFIIEDSTDGENKKRTTLGRIITKIFNRVAGFLNYQAPKTSLTPADATTATVDVSTAYDYTITPLGPSFTLALSNIPASGIAWSVTIYAIDWDGVTIALPSGSVTSGGTGLTFTPGGGGKKDRLVLRGNSGPSGEKEFYNLPGDMQ